MGTQATSCDKLPALVRPTSGGKFERGADLPSSLLLRHPCWPTEFDQRADFQRRWKRCAQCTRTSTCFSNPDRNSDLSFRAAWEHGGRLARSTLALNLWRNRKCNSANGTNGSKAAVSGSSAYGHFRPVTRRAPTEHDQAFNLVSERFFASLETSTAVAQPTSFPVHRCNPPREALA